MDNTDNISYQDYEDFARNTYKALLGADADKINHETINLILSKIKNIQNEIEDLTIALDYSIDTVHLCDGEGRVLRVSNEFLKQAGFNRADVEGRMLTDIEMVIY